MLRQPLFRVLCWMMIVVFPTSTMLADSGGAILQANGAVKINESAVNRSATVFNGDRVVTGKDSSAAITGKGTTILVAPGSLLIYGDQVTLSAGGAHFNGAFTVRAGAMTISPAAAKTRFEVRHEGGQVRINALEGNLSVSDGKQTTLLESGRTMASGKLPAVPAERSSIAPAMGLIIGLVMAAGMAVGLAVALSDDAVSPSTP